MLQVYHQDMSTWSQQYQKMIQREQHPRRAENSVVQEVDFIDDN